VHLDLESHRRPVAPVSLRGDVEIPPARLGGLPGNDEIARGVRRDRGIVLAGRRDRVDAELASERCTVARVPLAEDASLVAVLIATRLTDDDDAAGGLRSAARAVVFVGRVRAA